MNVRQKLSLAALCFTLPAMASAQAAPAAAEAAPVTATATATVTVPAPAPAAAAPAAAPAVTVTPYGVVWFNAFMSMGKFANTDFATQVNNEDQGSLIFQARQSRFGFNVAVKDGGFTGATLAARMEADFFGGAAGGATTSNRWDSMLLRLRYAFATATWDFKEMGKLQILAGQTDGLVNPLHPDSAAYGATPVFMQAGNIFSRTPQLRAQYDFKVMDMLSLTGQFALVSGGTADSAGAGSENLDWGPGNKSAIPNIEVRVAAAVKPTADISATLGVGYHTGKRVYPNIVAPLYTVDGTTKSYTASVIGIDLDAAITKYLGLRAEYYTGTGTDDTYYGIASGVVFDKNPAAAVYEPTGMRSSGYWAQAAIKPMPELTILAGMGQASVNTADLTTVNGAKSLTTGSTIREKNAAIHGGVVANAGKNWRFGLEVTRLTTSYWTAFSTGAGVYPATKPEMSATQIALSSRFVF